MVSVPAKTPPGPRGRLLLGSAPEFQRDPLSFFMRLRREYGPVVRFRMGPSTCYLLSDPEAVHQLLTLPPERVGKPAMVRKGFKKFFGDSLVVLEGQDHRERRRLIQPAFSPKRVDGYAEIMVARTEQMLGA